MDFGAIRNALYDCLRIYYIALAMSTGSWIVYLVCIVIIIITHPISVLRHNIIGISQHRPDDTQHYSIIIYSSLHRPYAAARLAHVVRDANDENDDGDIDSPEDVEILKVNSPCLEKVVEFLKHYHEEALTEIKTPLEDNTFEGNVKQEWYQNFLKGIDQPMLFDLVTAANFMAIQPLLDLTCLKVSCQLMGKSAE